MIPGELIAGPGDIELNPGAHPADPGGREHRGPAGAGRLPFSLRRCQRRAGVRPSAGRGLPARRPGRNRCPIRARGVAAGDPGLAWRDPPRPRAATAGGGGGVRLDRRRYAELYGPTVGDRLRLGDTDLWISPTEDRCAPPPPGGGPGDEAVFGGGKVLRESMGQALTSTVDLVITSVVVLDHWGVVKADVGVRDGRITAVGKAGNPDISDGVHPDLVIGPGTEVLAGEGRILTAGIVDCHVHLICPQVLEVALAAGTTTIVGGGTGPADGTRATTVTPGPWNVARMLQALDRWPVNVALLGKGNTVSMDALLEQGRSRHRRFQAARGLGLDAGRHRRLPGRGRPARRPSRHPHRHIERSRIRRRHAGRGGGPIDSRLPHRRRRGRPRPRHHHRGVGVQRPALVHQPHPAPHRQHH